jgi:ATP-binding cassette, subfamily B, bacterial
MAFFDRIHTSELNTMYKGLEEVRDLAGNQLPSIIHNLFILLLRGIYVLWTNGFLGGIVLGFLFLQGAIEMYLNKKFEAAWHSMLGTESACNRLREEAFARIRTIKEFSSEDEEHRCLCRALDRDRAVRLRLVHLWATRCGTAAALVACSGALVNFVGLRRVLAGTSTVGQVATFALLAATVKDAANVLLSACTQASEKAVRLAPALDLIDCPPRPAHTAGVELDRAAVRGEVVFSAVRFAYPSRPDPAVGGRAPPRRGPTKRYPPPPPFRLPTCSSSTWRHSPRLVLSLSVRLSPPIRSVTSERAWSAERVFSFAICWCSPSP